MGWLRWQRAVRGHYVALLRRFDTRHELPIWPRLLLLRVELPPSFTHKQCSIASARGQRGGHRHTCSGLTEALGVPSWLCWQRAVRGHYVALLRRFDTRHELPIWSGLLLLCVELQTSVGRDRGRSHRVACGDELCAGLKHAEVPVFFCVSACAGRHQHFQRHPSVCAHCHITDVSGSVECLLSAFLQPLEKRLQQGA